MFQIKNKLLFNLILWFSIFALLAAKVGKTAFFKWVCGGLGVSKQKKHFVSGKGMLWGLGQCLLMIQPRSETSLPKRSICRPITLTDSLRASHSAGKDRQKQAQKAMNFLTA